MKKYGILILLAILLIVGILLWLSRSTASQLFGTTLRNIETSEKVMALTFDDGPNPGCTERIVALLNRYNAKATFFVVGQEVQKYPDVFQHVVSQGHEIGNHSWSHTRLIFRSPWFIREQIESTDTIIRQLGYTKKIHFRAPFGKKLIVLPYILNRMDRTHVLWNVDLRDWKATAAEHLFRQFEIRFTNGSIIILHDGGGNRENTVKLVQFILEKYSARAYKFLTISELLTYNEM